MTKTNQTTLSFKGCQCNPCTCRPCNCGGAR
jgi:hypothetical protein